MINFKIYIKFKGGRRCNGRRCNPLASFHHLRNTSAGRGLNVIINHGQGIFSFAQFHGFSQRKLMFYLFVLDFVCSCSGGVPVK